MCHSPSFALMSWVSAAIQELGTENNQLSTVYQNILFDEVPPFANTARNNNKVFAHNTSSWDWTIYNQSWCVLENPNKEGWHNCLFGTLNWSYEKVLAGYPTPDVASSFDPQSSTQKHINLLHCCLGDMFFCYLKYSHSGLLQFNLRFAVMLL